MYSVRERLLVQAMFLEESLNINRMRIEAEGSLIPYRSGDNKYAIFDKSIEGYKDLIMGRDKEKVSEVPKKVITEEERDNKLKAIFDNAIKIAKKGS